MKSLAQKVQRFLVSEDGPTAVEYAVMLALIVIVCLTAIQSVGTRTSTTFNNVAKSLGATCRRSSMRHSGLTCHAGTHEIVRTGRTPSAPKDLAPRGHFLTYILSRRTLHRLAGGLARRAGDANSRAAGKPAG